MLSSVQKLGNVLVRKNMMNGAVQASNYATEATFETQPYKLHKLTEGPSTTVKMTRAEGLQFYKEMVTIRRMETVAANLYKSKAIRGFCHLYSGQASDLYTGV
ncbi:hypothetical protein DPMN_043276 [Dreissena polymorpha]|uniref:Uncharacterized protein n=1 Tax=Dreissena polymorpha TaxID=45954 RepID=A0A9D4HXS9_DREPO|nr:hypothetical protein DPMN_043276 [Dreissena polymorpha]